MQPFRDDEWEGPNSLPHVFLTQDANWDPKVLDLEQSENPEWYSNADDPPLLNPDFDIHEDYRHRIAYKMDRYDDRTTITDLNPTGRILVYDQDMYFDSSAEPLPDFVIETSTDHCVFHANLHCYVHNAITDTDPHVTTRQEHHGAQQVKDDPRDYQALCPCFTWLNSDIIRKTFEVMTQFARLPLNTVLRKCLKAPNPAMNVPRQDEPMATDTIQSDTLAINGGEKYAQFFVGVHSLLSDVHGMKSAASFLGVLTDQIIDHGVPTKWISDSAKVETSMAVHDILHTYGISSWQSEPYHQHQNPAKWCYQMVKCTCNAMLDRTGAPAYCWFLCLMYVCVILNNTYAPSICATPLRMVTGTTNDISQLVYFSFYKPVY
jgi:hypothetical protein